MINIEYLDLFNFNNKQEIKKFLEVLIDDLLKLNSHTILQKYNISRSSPELINIFIIKMKQRKIFRGDDIEALIIPPYIIFLEPMTVLFGVDIKTKQLFASEYYISRIERTLKELNYDIKQLTLKEQVNKLITYGKFYSCFFEYDHDVEIERIKRVIADDHEKRFRIQGDLCFTVEYRDEQYILNHYLSGEDFTRSKFGKTLEELQEEFYDNNEKEPFLKYLMRKFQKLHTIKMKQYTHEHTITLIGLELPYMNYVLTDEKILVNHKEHGEISVNITIYEHLYPIISFNFL